MKKIALIGSAPGSIMLAPYGDETWEIWGCSPAVWAHKQRMSIWFEIHKWNPGAANMSHDYCNYIRNFDGTVFMTQEVADVKNCLVLPHEELCKKYSEYFFTSSLSWMFAMAIEMGATEIGLWGVDMAADTEYGYQKAGCQYFAMIARAMGIKVTVPPESDLLTPPPLYGVCEQQQSFHKLHVRRLELQAKCSELAAQERAAYEQKVFIMGALDDLSYQQRTWTGNIGHEKSYLEAPDVPVLHDLVPPSPLHVVKDTKLDPGALLP